MMIPKGVLLDYGGTLVEELGFDVRAGNEWLLARASYLPEHVTLEQVLERAAQVSSQVADRRDQYQIETPWPALTRLIHHHCGTRFDDPMPELELGFWKASVRTRPMPGVREALEELHRSNLALAVVSNTSFGEHVIRYELSKHGLADHLAFIMVSAEYCVRKPNVLLFETAAARLGVQPKDIWFVGDLLDTDVAGARAAGMTSVWLRGTAMEDKTSQRADIIVKDWNELTRQFKNTKRL